MQPRRICLTWSDLRVCVPCERTVPLGGELRSSARAGHDPTYDAERLQAEWLAYAVAQRLLSAVCTVVNPLTCVIILLAVGLIMGTRMW